MSQNDDPEKNPSGKVASKNFFIDFEPIFDLIPALLCTAGPDGYFKKLNLEWEKTLGWTLAELQSKPLLFFIHPDDREPTLAEIDRQLKGQKTLNFENRYLCKDGTYKNLSWRATAASNDGFLHAAAIDITKTKTLESRYFESENKFYSIISSATDSIITINVAGKIVSWNKSSEKIFGYSELEALNQPIEIIIPDRYVIYHSESFKNFINTGVGKLFGQTTELIGKHKNGHEIAIELSLAHWNIGDQLFVTSIIRDISDRKKREQELIASQAALAYNEARFRILFESNKDAVMTLAPPSWSFTSANPMTVKMFGVSSEQHLIKLMPWDLSPEKQPDGENSILKARRMISLAMEKGSHFFDWEHRRLNGETFPATVLLSKVARHGKDFLQATVRDISEIKKAESEAIKNQATLRGILDSTGNPVFSVDQNYCYTSFNDSHHAVMKALFNHDIEVGKNIIDYHIREEDKRELKNNLDRVLRGEIVHAEKRYGEKERATYYTISHHPIRTNNDKVDGVAVFVVDITDQKKAEQERIEMQKKLLHSDKLASIGELAAGVAHEINNPLTVALGYNELVKKELLKNDLINVKFEQLLETSRGALERIGHIVKGLQTFARPGTDDVGVVDLHKAVDDTLNLIIDLYRKEGIQIEKIFCSTSPYLTANLGKLQQVIMNLLSNAKDAVASRDSERNIKIETYTEKSEICLSISDNGEGIDNEVLTRIFEPFYTTKPVGKGTGLGLSISHGIVSSFNGKIEVSSILGQGTTFTLKFPSTKK